MSRIIAVGAFFTVGALWVGWTSSSMAGASFAPAPNAVSIVRPGSTTYRNAMRQLDTLCGDAAICYVEQVAPGKWIPRVEL